jgi:hypothetical protein
MYALRHALPALALAAACAGSSRLVPPEGDPLVVGPVQSVTHREAASSIHVAAGPGSQEACGIVATADPRTRYLRRVSGDLREATREEVEVGTRMEVYVDGPVMESCPVQGRAAAFVLIEG